MKSLLCLYSEHEANTDDMAKPSQRDINGVYSHFSPCDQWACPCINESMLSKLLYHLFGLSFFTLFCFSSLSVCYLTKFLLESQRTSGVAGQSHRCEKLESLACLCWMIYCLLNLITSLGALPLSVYRI